jgi:hypothetical protein
MSEKCPVILKKYMKFITIKEILRQPQYVFDSPKHHFSRNMFAMLQYYNFATKLDFFG